MEAQRILLLESSETDARGIEESFRKARIRNPIDWVPSAARARAHLSGGLRSPRAETAGLPLFVLVGMRRGGRECAGFVGWVRAQEALRGLPVLLLYSSDWNLADAPPAGADGFFPKRLDLSHIGQLVMASGARWILRTGQEPPPPNPPAL